jgi:hypothetical protein
MKDLAHHMKKLNRKIIRSIHREEMEESEWDESQSLYARKQTPRQIKKQAKEIITKTRKARPATPLTPDQKNRKMKNRVPIFDKQNNAKPKQGARKTQKKTPRI